jgi:hypothetical protein
MPSGRTHAPSTAEAFEVRANTRIASLTGTSKAEMLASPMAAEIVMRVFEQGPLHR